MRNRTPRENVLSRLLPLLLAGALLALSACTGETPLPTRAALVAPVAAAPERSISGLPVTWTPLPVATEAGPANVLGPLAATPTPSITPILPTRTPITPSPTATPDVTATATRYVSYIPDLPPTDELGPSKLGLHVIRNNDPNIMNFVRQAQPAVIKAVDDLGFLAEVKQSSPWTIVVGRVDDVSGQNYHGNPEQAAQAYVARHLDQYRANPYVDYWEGWNEPDPNLNNMPWYARFEQERVRIMAANGWRTAVGGFATGVPEVDEFLLFLPAIETAMNFQGVLTLHEYSAPDMTYLYGAALPGFPAYPDRGALTFRYRWFYREVLQPRALEIPLIITEAGVDGIIGNRPGPQGRGWQDFQSYWVQQGWGSTGTEAFINQLAWYDVGARQDGYVIGFTIFTAGAIGHWEPYNVNPILPELTGYVLGQK